MKTWGAIALLLGACAGPVPECVDSGDGDAWPTAICGSELVAGDAPIAIEHGDGSRSLAMAVCSDAWSLACDETRFFDRDPGARLPVCSEVGAEPTCENGEDPHCVVVPCDGETYYGPAHPLGGS